jgi:RHS repeat-associated protein
MVQNRLYHVNETVAVNAFNDDIDDQGVFSSTNVNTANNYGYDGEGRLIRDDAEEIAQIKWTGTRRVKEVIRTSGSSKKNLKFSYDAMGQRIAKEVYDSQNNWERTTFYVRDPRGNVIAIYEKENNTQAQTLSYKVTERYIYGSSVVGLAANVVELFSAGNPSGTSFTHQTGERTYYESNHLGNVLSTVSDKIVARDWDNDLIIDYFRAEILSSTDFSAFGVELDGRKFVVRKARVDFNGKETDDETQLQNYDNRLYSPLLSRFISIDPIAMKFPWYSPYQFAGNKPIVAIDLDGLEEKPMQAATVTETSVSLAEVSYQGTAVTAVHYSTTIIGYYNGNGCEEGADPETQGACDPYTPSPNEPISVYTLDVIVYIDGNGDVRGGEYRIQSADYSAEDGNGQRTQSNYQTSSGNELTSWGPQSIGFAGASDDDPEVRFKLSEQAGNVMINTMIWNNDKGTDAPAQIENEATQGLLSPGAGAVVAVVGECVPEPLGEWISAAGTLVAMCDYVTSQQYSGIAESGITLMTSAFYTADGGDVADDLVIRLGVKTTNTPTAEALLEDPK